jgi:hypothetical protein
VVSYRSRQYQDIAARKDEGKRTLNWHVSDGSGVLPESGTCRPGTRHGPFTKPCYSKCTVPLELPVAIIADNLCNKLTARQRRSRRNLWIAIVHNADSPSVFDDLGAAVHSGSLLLAANSAWETVGALLATELLPGSASIFDSLKDRIA